jgi:hypothetical protein
MSRVRRVFLSAIQLNLTVVAFFFWKKKEAITTDARGCNFGTGPYICQSKPDYTKHGRCTWSRKPDSGASPQSVTATNTRSVCISEPRRALPYSWWMHVGLRTRLQRWAASRPHPVRISSYIKSIVGTTSLRNNENLYDYREVGQNAEALLRTMLVGKGRPGSCCAWKAP